MIRGKAQFALVLMALLVFVSGVYADEMPSELVVGKDLFETGRYLEALATVEGYLATEPDGVYTVAAQIFAGRCEVRLGRGLAAVRRAVAIIDRYGDEGPMAAQAYYLLATANQEMGDNCEAARALVMLLDRNPDEELAQTARDHLRALLKGPVAYRAQTLMMIARTPATQDSLREMFPASFSQATIGLMVPESKEATGPAEQIIKGVRAALEQFRLETGNEVALELVRTPKSAAHAVANVRELIRAKGVWGLIAVGPEPVVVAAAVEAQAAGVPVILPGMRRDGLGALGPTAVLPDADWRREGELLASYALDSLRLHDYAIVAPYTDQGQSTVAGFRDYIEKSDSTRLLAMEWYFPEEEVSLSGQFQRIRNLGFRLQFQDTLFAGGRMRPYNFELPPFPGDTSRFYVERVVLDTVLTRYFGMDSLWIDTLSVDTVKVDTLALTPEDSLNSSLMEWVRLNRIAPFDSTRFAHLWQARLDSIKRTVEFKTGLIDSNAIEISVYDGLFLLIEPGTIPFFAPQFAFYNFNTIRLGNSAWYDPEALYKHRQYVQDFIFPAPYWLDLNEGPITSLRTSLLREGVREVTSWNIRGFDAASILLDQIEKGRVGPQDVGEGITKLDSVSLAAGLQHFEERQLTGRNMWLLTYQEDRVKLEDLQARLDSLYPPVESDTLLFDPDSLGEVLSREEEE